MKKSPRAKIIFDKPFKSPLVSGVHQVVGLCVRDHGRKMYYLRMLKLLQFGEMLSLREPGMSRDGAYSCTDAY